MNDVFDVGARQAMAKIATEAGFARWAAGATRSKATREQVLKAKSALIGTSLGGEYAKGRSGQVWRAERAATKALRKRDPFGKQTADKKRLHKAYKRERARSDAVETARTGAFHGDAKGDEAYRRWFKSQLAREKAKRPKSLRQRLSAWLDRDKKKLKGLPAPQMLLASGASK